MALTDVLAVIGAVTGTTGSILGVMSYRRDRPKIVLVTGAAKGMFHDDFLLRVELRNAGRQSATVTLVEVVRVRARGFGLLIFLGRFGRGRKLLAWVWRLQTTGTPLDEQIEEPVALAPNERKEYVLKAAALNEQESSRRGYTYVYARKISGGYISRRVDTDVDVTKWTDLF
jgi:hypothetical protein